MKRLFAVLSLFLLLCACGKQEPAESPQPEPEPVEQEIQQELPPQEVPITVTEPSAPVEYTADHREELIEDAVGCELAVPVFGQQKMDDFYEDLYGQLIDYTKETVFPETVNRGCVATVTGQVESVTEENGAVTVVYAYDCDFSEGDDLHRTCTDTFDLTTGEHIK